jgi:ferritin-like metal-binding protein YciE
MPPDSLSEQLIKYLTDAHSIEKQALAQMEAAPDLADDPSLAELFARHHKETVQHERRVRELLESLGAKPSALKDVAGTVTGKGFVLFAGSQPDTPGKLVVHGFSYEHMELAAYELIAELADRANAPHVAEVAREIAAEERAMADALAERFDNAIEGSLRAIGSDDIDSQLHKYLGDAHAIEKQSEELLDKATDLAGAPPLESAYEDHLIETRQQLELVEARLNALGDSPSVIKDAALRLGALNWGAFFGAQPDTPAKLAAFAYAVEHLEIAGYEMLKRVARRAGDGETEQMADRILAQEHEAAEKVHSLFDQALSASLHEQGLSVR